MKRLIFLVLAALMVLAVSCKEEKSPAGPKQKYGVDGVTPMPEAVDLGLPSGLKWASFNLGASKPEEFGDYYAWGETETHYSSLNPLTWKDGMEDGYSWSNYKFGTGDDGDFSKYNASDPQKSLETGPDGDDVASKALGGNWRMPTKADWGELLYYCLCTLKTTADGYACNGYLFTGNSNSIFLPLAGHINSLYYTYHGERGYYWTSSFDPEDPTWNRCIELTSECPSFEGCGRRMGHSIRPVYVE